MVRLLKYAPVEEALTQANLPQTFPLLAAPRPAARRPSGSAVASKSERTDKALLFVYVMWFIILGDPQWFIASLGPQLVLKIPTLMFGVLLLWTLMKSPRRLLPPLLAFVVYTVLSVPFAYVRGEAVQTAKTVIGFYVITLATLTFVRTTRQAVPILLWALVGQYLMWAALGAKSGLVYWHFAYANYDGFGPLMVIGLSCSFYAGMAVKSKKWRRIAFLTAGLCIVALVSSFARGAVLSGGAVALWMWVRSKHKVKTTMLGVAALLVLVIAASVIKGSDKVPGAVNYSNFWQEMASSFNNNDGTASDREVLWGLAVRVWERNPVFGVGPNCFGAYAADHFAIGEVGGNYADNPKTLWGRKLHNTYYQILSEFGLAGVLVVGWMLWDFFRRNRALRRPARVQLWTATSGGLLDLRYVSLGLESAMIGFLLTSYFYNQIFDINWFYTLLTLNALLFHLTRPNGRTAPVPVRARGPLLVPAR